MVRQTEKSNIPLASDGAHLCFQHPSISSQTVLYCCKRKTRAFQDTILFCVIRHETCPRNAKYALKGIEQSTITALNAGNEQPAQHIMQRVPITERSSRY